MCHKFQPVQAYLAGEEDDGGHWNQRLHAEEKESP